MSSNGQIEERIWSRNLVTVMICAMCIGMSGQLLHPTFQLYLVEIGIDSRYAGSMISAFSIGSLIFRPISGFLVDTFGRKKMALIGASIILISYTGYLLSKSFWIMLVIRVLQGVGFAFANTSNATIASDVIPKSRLTEGIGYYAMAGAVSMTIGPATGLFIYESFPMQMLFGMGICLATICILTMSTLTYEEKLRPRPEGKIKIKIIEKDALLPALMIFIVAFSQVALTTFLALYALELGIASVSIYFLLNSIGTISARFFAGRLTRRFGEQTILIGAILIVATGQLLVSFLNGLTMLCFIAVMYGFGYGVINPITNSLAIKRATAENRGSANATYTSAFSLASLVGGIIWGIVANGSGVMLGDGVISSIIANGVGYSNMYIISASIVLINIPLSFYYKKIYGFDNT